MKARTLSLVLPGMFGEPLPPFAEPGRGPDHDGETYEREQDHVRLNAQTLGVWQCLRSGYWMTLYSISQITGYPEASVSARLRDLRKPQFGGHTVERRRVAGGLYEYRMVPNPMSGVVTAE